MHVLKSCLQQSGRRVREDGFMPIFLSFCSSNLGISGLNVVKYLCQNGLWQRLHKPAQMEYISQPVRVMPQPTKPDVVTCRQFGLVSSHHHQLPAQGGVVPQRC